MTPKVFKRKEADNNTLLGKASYAVERYQEDKELLERMQESFKSEYPDAYSAYLSILAQMDKVQESIKEAHALVQEAKESMGDFRCVRKWKSAGYDPVEFINLLSSHDNPGDVVEGLVKSGAVEKIVLSERAKEFFAMNPQYGNHFQIAWRDRIEATAAVTSPKITAVF